MTLVKLSAGGRPAASRKMQRYSLLKTVGAVLLTLGLIAVLFQNDPFPGVRKAAMRHRRQAELQRDFRNPEGEEVADAGATAGSGDEGGDAENKHQLEDGGRIFTFELESLTDGGKGKVVIETKPSWAPLGVQHFHELMDANFYDQAKFFRVVTDFVVQFGIAANPANKRPQEIQDDPVVQTNARGTLTYATSGPNTRTTQLFINTRKNGNGSLDRQGFAPIGEVIRYVLFRAFCFVERIATNTDLFQPHNANNSGMEFVDAIYAGYAQRPDQGKIQRQGNAYLDKEFPLLSYISKAYKGEVMEGAADGEEENNN